MDSSEKNQMKAVLDEMGIDSFESLEDLKDYRPIPEGPVRRPKVVEATNASELSPELESQEDKSQTSEILAENINTENIETTLDQTYGGGISNDQVTQHSEITASTLLRLMGMPTSRQILVIDGKLDIILGKLMTLQAKIDRVNSQFEVLNASSSTDRLEFQVSEIRNIMKKFFPQAFSSVKTSEVRSETEIHVNVAPQSLVENENMEEEPLSDEDYQVLEAQKLREN
jgi:hypothetical protein